MISGTINDVPTIAPAVIDPAQLAAINQVWMNNALFLGKFCLVIGFLIGVYTGYFFCRWYISRKKDTHFLETELL